MRIVLAIVCSVFLVLGQTATLLGAQCLQNTAPKACACSDCAKTGCCVAKKAPTTVPSQPVAPASNTAQEAMQLVAPPLALMLALPSVKFTGSSHTIFPVGPTASAPLYVRNCSYLI